MNSKVKISQTRLGLVCIENKHGTQLAQSQSVPGRPLLAPLYRWTGLKYLVGFNTNYNVCIRYQLVFRLHLCLGLPNGPRGTKIMGLISYTLVSMPPSRIPRCHFHTLAGRRHTLAHRRNGSHAGQHGIRRRG
jgi:hypothetical protein